MHEDIIYWSNDWGGQILREFVEDNSIGMLGLIGSHFLTPMFAGWWTEIACRGQVRQGIGQGKKYRVEMTCMTRTDDKDRDVVAVDDLWMVIKRNLFDSISFDSKTYKGFHFYDTDICIQVIKSGYKIRIVDNVDVEHKSLGNIGTQYYLDCIRFHKKWDAYLPVCSLPVSQEIMQQHETSVMESYFRLRAAYYEQNKMLKSIFHRVATKLYVFCKRLSLI